MLSTTSELLTIVLTIVICGMFFLAGENIYTIAISGIVGGYIIYSFIKNVKKHNTTNYSWIGSASIAVFTFIIGYIYFYTILANCMIFICVLMFARTIIEIVHAISINSTKEIIDSQIKELLNTVVSDIKISIDNEKILNNSIVSKENLEKHINDIRLEYEQRFINLSTQIQSNEKDLISFKIASEDKKKELESKLATYKDEIIKRNDEINKMRIEQDIYIKQLQEKNELENYPLENRTIRDKFDESLSIATKELDIFSPWINSKVVDSFMIDKFRALLDKGVLIKIRYGIGELSTDNKTRDKKTENMVQKLKEEFKCYANFKMYRDNSHVKLFICDDKYYVISSFNILSFDGKYDKTTKDHRRELGEYSTNREILKKYRERYFNF